MKNTAGVCQAAEVQNTQRVLESAGNIYLIKKETEVSLKLTIMLLMKKYKQLISEQRYAIYLGLEEGTSKKDIALRIGVHISTLYRELERNKNKRGGYSRRLAHEMAGERKERLPGNRFTLPFLIVHGKKERLKTGINLPGNISRKRHHLKIIRMRISKKSGTN